MMHARAVRVDEIARWAPDEQCLSPYLLVDGNGKPGFGAEALYIGDHGAAENVLLPMTRIGKPVHSDLKPHQHLDLQTSAPDARRMSHYIKTG